MNIGLCETCVFHSLSSGKRGSEFHLCTLSRSDQSFPKYPRLPVLTCTGFRKAGTEGTNTEKQQDKK